jgi:pyocin large subunit-like protein
MADLTYAQSAILAALTKAANAGAPCPKNIDLCEVAGLKAESSAQSALKRLTDMGLIVMTATPNWRIATLPNGKSTAQPRHAKPEQGARPSLRVVSRVESVKLPDPAKPRVFRDPCPFCATRMDADPALCCPRGRAIRKMVA